jgi:hypothetical protein
VQSPRRARRIVGGRARGTLYDLHRRKRHVVVPWTRSDLHPDGQSSAAQFAGASQLFDQVA